MESINTKATDWLNDVMIDYNSFKPDGGAVVIFETIDELEYIHHNPNTFPFVNSSEIETIKGREFVKSSYLLPILERRFEMLFILPSNKRE